MAILTIQPSSKDNALHWEESATNYGTATTNRVGVNYGDQRRRGLVEFAITWGTDIPAGATLTSATLSLYMDSVSGASKTYRAQRLVRLDWHETQSTPTIYKTGSNWSTFLAGHDGNDYTSANQASTTNPAANNWMSWDVLAQVQTAQTGNLQIAFRIIHNTEATNLEFIYFRSKEHATTATRPKLVIEYAIVKRSFGCIMG